MIAIKKAAGLLAIAFVLCLADCLNDKPDEGKAAFSYTADELTTVFNTDEKTLTMNKWFPNVPFNWMKTDYDQWLQQGDNGLFKDKALTRKFLGSDLIKASTVIYSDSSLNWQGPKIGTVTGTIKLTGVPSEKVKIYLSAASGRTWSSNGAITGPVEENKDMNWSFPVYDKQVNPWGGTLGFEPSETEFTLLVLSETAQNGYKVNIPTKKTISSVNENVGSLDTVDIKGVQLKGTFNATYDGKPVPYVEIYARWDVQGVLETTYLLSPGKDAPWSILLEKSSANREISFQVFFYSKQDYTTNEDLIADYYVQDTYYVKDNDVSNITIDLIK